MNIFYWSKKNLELKKISRTGLIGGVIFITLILLRTGYEMGFNQGKKSEITEKDVILLFHETENNSFSKKNFYQYLKEVNIKFPEIVFAQAMKESGFKSPLFKTNNNPFGMKEASKRPNMQNGVQGDYAYYNTWKNAVVDYALYQTTIGVNKLKTENEYLNFLKEMNYFDVDHPNNVNYLSDLKSIADNIEKYLED